jgi:pimeloyl-ACP methyl ester carboxylesterase
MNALSSYVLIGDMRVRYLIWDGGWQGQPVVMLHGLASNARIWEKTALQLLGGGLYPIALDQRGHGLTDGTGGDYSFDVFFRDLSAFLEICNVERPILVGHSWGAMVALDFAARVKMGSLAPIGLVLVDGGITQLSDVPGATWESTRERLAPPKLAGMPLAEFTARVKEGAAGWTPDDDSLQIILANFAIGDDETISPHLAFENHMKIVRAMWESRTYEMFKEIRCPVMAVPARPTAPMAGPSADFLALKERGLSRIREIKPDLRVEWMVDTVHDIPLQHPDRLAALILDFARGIAG